MLRSILKAYKLYIHFPKCVEGGRSDGKNETLDSALRRFKRATQKAGILSEVRKREHYEKPSVQRKKKSEAARKRKSR